MLRYGRRLLIGGLAVLALALAACGSSSSSSSSASHREDQRCRPACYRSGRRNPAVGLERTGRREAGW